MYRNQLKTIGYIALCSLLAVSCKKKDDDSTVTPTSEKTEVHVNFANFAGSDSLKLNTGTYTNAAGEQFTVSTFNYYISNVKLNGTGNTPDYTETESYHLVRQGTLGSGHFHLEEVPLGDYKSITFLVGVDSARNVSGAQSGALAVDNGMFWSWNTGYIMAKMEGTSPASTQTGGAFKFHTGGFKGVTSVLRTVTLDFPSAISIKSGMTGDLVIKADALKWFTPNLISIAAVNTVMTEGATAAKIADNYSKMFSIVSAQTAVE